MEKNEWIREQCTDYFEGIPCSYPRCCERPDQPGCCSMVWNMRMEIMWDDHMNAEGD